MSESPTVRGQRSPSPSAEAYHAFLLARKGECACSSGMRSTGARVTRSSRRDGPPSALVASSGITGSTADGRQSVVMPLLVRMLR